MKAKIIPFPNAKKKWETDIFSAFSKGDDVSTLRLIEIFHQLYGKKSTFHLLASLCHYHLGEEDEALQFILDLKQIRTEPSKNELYGLYTMIFNDSDFWLWHEWIVSMDKDVEMKVWLQEWLAQITPPRYKILRNVEELLPKVSPFVEQFNQIFLQNDDVGMQLAWLKSEQTWEKSEFFFESCQAFFLKESAHPFIQTLLLQQLKFEQVSYYFQIKKSNRQGDFDIEKIDFPLFSLNERKMIQEIQSYEAKNISYAQQMLRAYQQYVMYFYPFVNEYIDTFIEILVRYTNEIFGQKVNQKTLTDEEYLVYQELIQANQPIFSL